MRPRISVEQLNSPITSETIASALKDADHLVKALSVLTPSWLTFCNEKLSLASESMIFLLKQRFNLFKRGYPSREIEYLCLIERQVKELEEVFLSFYHLAPGLIHQIRSEQMEIYAWLMLHTPLGEDKQNLLCGLSVFGDMPFEFSKYIVIQSSNPDIDYVLTELVDGQSKFNPLYFDCLRVRQSLSISVIKRWLKFERIPEGVGYCALAVQDIEEGVNWVNENGDEDKYLFERLLIKNNKSTWFRKAYGVEQKLMSNHNIVSFAKLLELKEFSYFDVTSDLAHVDFALCGDSRLVPEILSHLENLEEEDGEIWIKSLYVVYGALLPFSPRQVGIDLEWKEIITLLKEWRIEECFIQPSYCRLGKPLKFESSFEAMKSPDVDEVFRSWIWKQICIHSRIYIPWDPMMPVHQQDLNLQRVKAIPSASERFDLRSNHAIVGY